MRVRNESKDERLPLIARAVGALIAGVTWWLLSVAMGGSARHALTGAGLFATIYTALGYVVGDRMQNKTGNSGRIFHRHHRRLGR